MVPLLCAQCSEEEAQVGLVAPEDVGPAEAETLILPRTPDEPLVVDERGRRGRRRGERRGEGAKALGEGGVGVGVCVGREVYYERGRKPKESILKAEATRSEGDYPEEGATRALMRYRCFFF